MDFDGTNDYLSRASDLVGNTDGKTFTFSSWVYWTGETQVFPIYFRQDGSDGSGNFYLRVEDTGNVSFGAYNSANNGILAGYSSSAYVAPLTWTNITLSVDLATSSKYLFINDIDKTSNLTWSMTNDFIDFTSEMIRVMSNPFGST